MIGFVSRQMVFLCLMQELPVLFPETLPAEDFQGLYRAVCDQIEKDFRPHAQMAKTPQVLTPEWIYSELERMLQEIVARGGADLGAVVYRVDLKETHVRKTMGGSSASNRIKELTSLILKREAQKVWLRKHLRP
jgi:hypothetical protein